MQIIEKNIDEIKAYKNNPRHNENAIDTVAESIRQFGFKVPIVIDENGVIIAGHTRMKASEKLGLETVPCIIADDLTEEQIKAFRLADNKVSELAGWDFKILDEELDEIANINMEDFGFTESESIDWDDIEDLEAEVYEEPTKNMLECPACHHKGNAALFKKVTEE